jgi:hypothetical protein
MKKNASGIQIEVPIVPPPSDTAAGEIDPDVDDEDTEEEMEALIKDVEAALAELPQDSVEGWLATALLLKVRGFIAKVRHIIIFSISF